MTTRLRTIAPGKPLALTETSSSATPGGPSAGNPRLRGDAAFAGIP